MNKSRGLHKVEIGISCRLPCQWSCKKEDLLFRYHILGSLVTASPKLIHLGLWPSSPFLCLPPATFTLELEIDVAATLSSIMELRINDTPALIFDFGLDIELASILTSFLLF